MTENELQTGQARRLESARCALAAGLWTFTPAGQGWRVRTPHSEYLLAQNGGEWGCSCPDHVRNRDSGLECKHIHGLRLRLQQPGPANPHPTLNTERNPMNTTTPILERLQQPLDMSRVKRRQAPGQGSVPYLEGYDLIETANQIFEFGWSFDLLSEPHVMRWDKIVTFYDPRSKKKLPVLGENGQPTTEMAGIVYVTGRISVEIGGKPWIHADVGRCIFMGDTPEALDMALAGAVTDCLKRCFRQCGEQFGNSLYDKEVARTAGTDSGPEPRAGRGGGNGNGRKPAPPALPDLSLEAARSIPCPFGTTQNPALKGMALGEVAALESGPKVLAYLAEQWQAADPAGLQAKSAARMLLTPVPA